MSAQKIEIMANMMDANERIAQETNQCLTEKGIFVINVMGAPGAGKTSVITALIQGLEDTKCYVVEGDIESDLDTRKLQEMGIEALQINTHGACHLDAPTLQEALVAIPNKKPGVLFIENIGNLVCPAEFVIGEHIKLLVTTVTEGSDKPYKYPLAFEKADVIVINKADLMPYVDFDEDFFMAGVRALNPTACIVKGNSKDKKTYEEVVTWIKERVAMLKH
ncbi:MAG: hydrogenase nickel incorporation protein HypB [Cellulosilyticaceae bacterium]